MYVALLVLTFLKLHERQFVTDPNLPSLSERELAVAAGSNLNRADGNMSKLDAETDVLSRMLKTAFRFAECNVRSSSSTDLFL